MNTLGNRDYQFLASGYRHEVFHCGGYVYKVVKDAFGEENCREHFETECLAMNLMREKGFNVPSECTILSPKDSFKHKWTLRESRLYGMQYRDGEMPLELEKKVYDLLIELGQSLTGNYYGQITPYANTNLTWHAFLKQLYNNHPLTSVAVPDIKISNNRIDELIEFLVPRAPVPVFITMDTNLMNFFFDASGNIVGIIDIERPVYGDFAFLLADIRWCRDHWFHRNDWYSFWAEGKYGIREELIDLYVFLIAYEEIEYRHKTNTTHHNLIKEFLRLENKLLNL